VTKWARQCDQTGGPSLSDGANATKRAQSRRHSLPGRDISGPCPSVQLGMSEQTVFGLARASIATKRAICDFRFAWSHRLLGMRPNGRIRITAWAGMEKHWFEANATKRATWKYGLAYRGAPVDEMRPNGRKQHLRIQMVDETTCQFGRVAL
jgi:hypothetical protein